MDGDENRKNLIPTPNPSPKLGTKFFFILIWIPVKLGSNEYTHRLEVGVYVIRPTITCGIKLFIGRLNFNISHLTSQIKVKVVRNQAINLHTFCRL